MIYLRGCIGRSGGQTEDWHREYKIKWLIETDNSQDGPYRAMTCPGLPAVFSYWIFGNDNDQWAYCHPNWTVQPFKATNEKNYLWVVEQTFSTKPIGGSGQQQPNQNPLAAPYQISGTFIKYTEEATVDKDGKPIKSTSHERIRGPMVEFDANRPTVSIGANYGSLGLNVFSQLIDNVNDSAMWGLQKRMVKLSNVRWTRNLYGQNFYYTRDYDFDINFKTFDRIIPDTGTKQLMTGGNKLNTTHWKQAKDSLGNPIRNEIYYNADGTQWDGLSGEPNKITVKKYPETNLFILGIPSSF